MFNGQSFNDWGYSVQECLNGGYIISGTTNYSSVSGGIWLIKTDASGIEEWDRTFSSGTGLSVKQTFDTGYIIAGSTTNNYESNGWDVWLIKTDAYGYEEWNHTFDGGYDDWGYSIGATEDGGFVIVGNSIQSGNSDIIIIKTDPEGNVYE